MNHYKVDVTETRLVRVIYTVEAESLDAALEKAERGDTLDEVEGKLEAVTARDAFAAERIGKEEWGMARKTAIQTNLVGLECEVTRNGDGFTGEIVAVYLDSDSEVRFTVARIERGSSMDGYLESGIGPDEVQLMRDRSGIKWQTSRMRRK